MKSGSRLSEDHPVATIQAAAQPAGSRNSSDAATKDHNSLAGAAFATGH